MISVKGRDHRYRLVNREFELAHGRSSAWIVGRSDDTALPPATLRDVRAKDLAVIESGVSSQEEELSMTTTAGSGFVSISRFPLPNADGAIDAVCVAATDITDRHAEDRRQRERLECSALIYSALAEDRYVLHGQPIVALRGDAAPRAELLIRMRDTRRQLRAAPSGSLPPRR